MKTNKKPVWITIPEEGSKKSIPLSSKKEAEGDKVSHKGFWAAGFIALLVFSFALSLPQQLSKFMKAELFDANFQVVPDSENNTDNKFFSDPQAPAVDANTDPKVEVTPKDTPAPTPAPVQAENQVQAESDAVPLQLDPVDNGANQPAVTPDELLEDTPTETPEDTLPPEAPSDFQKLLQSLSAQLEDLKKSSQEKDAQIQALMDQLQNPSDALHSAAENTSTQNPSNNLPPANTAPQDSGEYRYNTHTVTVSPYDVLNQNRLSASQIQQQGLQANALAVNSQNNMALSGVQNQPATGPGEALLVALVLSAALILGFGIYRNARA